jgi:metallo-beta-lactamase class B
MKSQGQKTGGASAAGARMLLIMWAVAAAIFLAGPSLMAQAVTLPPRADNTNHQKDPFRMIGNIYWVGHTQVGSYLIKTPQGDILMDTTSAKEAPWVRDNIEKLGIKLKDIKIILNSHPHAEHMGGFAMFKELTGANIITSKLTADEMAVGGRTDFREDGSEQYKPIKPDQTVDDGGTVELGGVKLTAYITPGHTKGCTTWTTTVEEDGKKYNVVFFCGMAVAGIDRAPLLNNPKYPNIVEDFEHSYKVLRSLPCDVFLYARATTIKLDEKQKRLNQGEKPNPFVDPAGCRGYIDDNENEFLDQLAQQRAALQKKNP